MFTYNKEANCNWFAGTSASKEMLAEYHLIGVVGFYSKLRFINLMFFIEADGSGGL